MIVKSLTILKGAEFPQNVPSPCRVIPSSVVTSFSKELLQRSVFRPPAPLLHRNRYIPRILKPAGFLGTTNVTQVGVKHRKTPPPEQNKHVVAMFDEFCEEVGQARTSSISHQNSYLRKMMLGCLINSEWWRATNYTNLPQEIINKQRSCVNHTR